MTGTSRARVRGGVLEPLDELDLPDGTEVTLTIIRVGGRRSRAAFLRAAGAWKGRVDAKQLIRDIYESRGGRGGGWRKTEAAT